MKNFLNLSLLILGFVLFLGYRSTHAATVLKYVEKNQTIVLLSMAATFTITEDGKSDEKYKLDDKLINVTGNIAPNPTYQIINFIVTWNETYDFILTFNVTPKEWYWSNSTFVVHKPHTIIPLTRMISSFGDGQAATMRNQSYSCQSPLDVSSVVNPYHVSLTWSQFQVEVYPTNNTKFDSASRTCTVDLDDKIVPIAVGGALGLLLLLVVIIYVISYIRDRRQQSKELRSGYNRIDQPEPNHHS